MKSNQFLKEGFVEDASEVNADHEVQMARADLFYAAENALALHKLLRNVSEQQGLEGWVAAKITLASDYLKTVREYLEYELMSAPATVDVLPVAEGLGKDLKRLATGKDAKSRAGQEIAKSQDASMKGDNRTANKHFRRYDKLDKLANKGVAEGSLNEGQYEMMMRNGQVKKFIAKDDADAKRIAAGHGAKSVIKLRGGVPAGKVSEQGVAEGSLDNPGQPDNPVAQAIIRRILMQRTDLLSKYGPEYVGQAVDDVADFVGDVEEIGSSDISGWVRQVEQNLKTKLNQYDEPMRDIDNLAEMSSGSVATVVNPTPKNKSKVGTLFGGTYKQKKTK